MTPIHRAGPGVAGGPRAWKEQPSRLRPDALLGPRQLLLGLRQPVRHPHFSEHRDRRRQLGAGLVEAADAAVQLAEAEVTASSRHRTTGTPWRAPWSLGGRGRWAEYTRAVGPNAYRGIVGKTLPRFRTFEYALGLEWMLLLHTDGVSARFAEADMLKVRRSDPQELTRLLLERWS